MQVLMFKICVVLVELILHSLWLGLFYCWDL